MNDKPDNIKHLTKKHWIIAGASLVAVVVVLILVLALTLVGKIQTTKPALDKPSVGLLYEKASESEAYMVAGIGVCKDSNIVIPSEHNGLPVVGIRYEAFKDCTQIKSIKIPDGVTKINYAAFEGCTSLTDVEISNDVTYIGHYAFKDCTALSNVTIPDRANTIASDAFSNCTSLEVIYWNARACTEVASESFKNCTSLKTIVIGENVTMMPKYVFSNCTSLETVYWNAIACTEAGLHNGSIFKNCTSLKTVVIEDNVTIIPDYAFYDSKSLTSVTIPNSVTSIGWGAFQHCWALREIHYNGTTAQWNAISKGSYWNEPTGSYTVYCTDGNIKK